HIVEDAHALTLLFDEAISKGLEGLVVKKLESRYEAGARNFNWVKLKRHSAGALNDTIDCVLLGYLYGRGKRAAFGAGSLLVGLYDPERDLFVTVTKIGTGLSDEQWRSIRERTRGLEVDHRPARVSSLIEPSVWVEPRIVIEVLADEITHSPTHTAGKVGAEPGYALRFPRLVSFREADKHPEEIQAQTGNTRLHWYRADFSELSQVRALAERLAREQKRLDVLVNNAGIGTTLPGEGQRQESEDGYELRFAVNYLAPFLLTRR